MAIKLDFNKPYLVGSESAYINDAVRSGHISGNGKYTKKCHTFFESKYNFPKVLLTSSCTDALEMAAILLNIQPGDEVIMPSYTFVSTANAFALRGAKIVFTDSRKDHPGMDEDAIESLITSRTKAIVPVHYAGVACDMVKIMHIANRHQIKVVEDAAQAIDSYCLDTNGNLKPLGSWGHLAAFSFHETKNIISGEGGMLVINDESYIDRAEIIWEKGTNRSQFFRGQVDKYGWVDIGSSFLPSDIIAAFLFAQLENIEYIQNKRIDHWNSFYNKLKPLADQNHFSILECGENKTNNGHLFAIVLNDLETRSKLLAHMKDQHILAVFHYLSLHKSMFYSDKHDGRSLENCDHFSDTLVRLPFYYELTCDEIDLICNTIIDYFDAK
jgi:dTDP-4-amino-4,6-dideoxygalactose transaminase